MWKITRSCFFAKHRSVLFFVLFFFFVLIFSFKFDNLISDKIGILQWAANKTAVIYFALVATAREKRIKYRGHFVPDGLLLVKWSRAANWYAFDSNLYLPRELLRSARPNQLEIDVQVHTAVPALFVFNFPSQIRCQIACRDFYEKFPRCIFSRLTGSLHWIRCRLKLHDK